MKGRRKLVTAMVAAPLAAAAGTAWWFRRSPRIPEVIRIGVGQPLSGGLAELGQDMANGAQLAVDAFNADTSYRIRGQSVRFQIVSADDRADAEVGKAVAAQLVGQDIVAAIAHLNSGVSIAAAPIYAAAGVPQIAISTKPQFTQLGLPTTLRLVANDDMQARAIGAHAAGLGDASRFAVVDDNTPYGKGLADGAAKVLHELGKSVVLRRSLDDKRTDFSALVGEFATAKVDVLVTTLADFQVISMLPQLAAAGLGTLRIVGGDTIKTSRMAQAEVPIRAVMATSPIVDASEFPAGPRFVAQFRNRFNTDPVYGAHYAYDAVCLIADALRRNGSADRHALLERLKQFDGNCPVTNSIRFTESGEQKYSAVAVYELEPAGPAGGRWATVYRTERW